MRVVPTEPMTCAGARQDLARDPVPLGVKTVGVCSRTTVGDEEGLRLGLGGEVSAVLVDERLRRCRSEQRGADEDDAEDGRKSAAQTSHR